MLRSFPPRTAIERAASVANLAMLRANDLPNRLHIEAISEYTSFLESELASLSPDDTTTRMRISAQLDIHRAILAPIRRLPKELLIDIFFRVTNKTPLRTLHVAVTLSRVCAVWRAVAHGLPKLWTKLVVTSMRDFDQYCELFLPLSKGIPIELRCDNGEVLSPLWDSIAPYASRWRRVTLEGRLCMLPHLKVLYMENLERLVVDAYDGPDFTELSALDFVVAPHLRHIGLTIDVVQSERQLHIPVTQALTSLDITAESPFPVTHTLTLLQACAETLQSLILKVRHPLTGSEGSYPTTASDTFTMKALTMLSLCGSACALLNHISAPLVDQIILSNVPEYGTTSLLGFSARNQASRHLRVLRVYQVEEKDIWPWIPCLWLMDNLRELHFDELLTNAEFLRLLVRRADQPTILPSLEHASLVHIFVNYPHLHDAIGDMCASRSKVIVEGENMVEVLFGWIKE